MKIIAVGYRNSRDCKINLINMIDNLINKGITIRKINKPSLWFKTNRCEVKFFPMNNRNCWVNQKFDAASGEFYSDDVDCPIIKDPIEYIINEENKDD